MNRIRFKLYKAVTMLLVFVLAAGCGIAAFGERVYAKDSNGDIVIVIDPGHGGYDGGANAGSTGDNESDLNWNIAKYMKAELETYAGVRVYVTRANNEWNTNTARAHMGKSVGADFVISIHNNSSSTASTNGFVAYGSVADGYVDATKNLCLNMARYAQAAGLGLFSNGYLTRASGSNPSMDYYTVIDEGVKSGIPTIIAEHCFLTNSSDAAFIHETENQRKVGVGDATAVAEYFGLSKRTISDGQSVELDRSYSAYFVPANQRDGSISFSSSDDNVAHVRSDGLITAVNAGTATVTYTYADGTSGSCTFTTKPVVQVGVSAGINPTVYKSSEQIAAIDKSKIIVKAIYSDGTSRQMTSGYTIGDIDPNYEGRQYVSVSHNGFSASLLIRLDPGAEAGNYSDYLYQIKGGYADIFTYPELVSISGVSGSPYTSNGFENSEKPTQPETTTQAPTETETLTQETTTAQETESTAETTTEAESASESLSTSESQSVENASESSTDSGESKTTQPTADNTSSADSQINIDTNGGQTTDGSNINKENKSMDWIIAVLLVLIVLMIALIVIASMSIRKNNRYNRRLEQREKKNHQTMDDEEPKRKRR